jgi:hypothetical protein
LFCLFIIYRESFEAKNGDWDSAQDSFSKLSLMIDQSSKHYILISIGLAPDVKERLRCNTMINLAIINNSRGEPGERLFTYSLSLDVAIVQLEKALKTRYDTQTLYL